MSSKNVAVFGIYATPGTAEAAVDHLLANGFTIGLVYFAAEGGDCKGCL